MKMMKKVLMILAVTALVLSMAGCVAADKTAQEVYNKTVVEKGSAGWTSNPVNITLNLENDFVVTIPADFNLAKHTSDSIKDSDGRNLVYYTTPHGDNVKPIQVNVDVTLLERGQNVSVNVSAVNGYYDDSYIYSNAVGTISGAWNLSASEGPDVIHYLLATGDNNHFTVTSNYGSNNKLDVSYSGLKILTNNSNVLYTSASADAVLHVIVINEPSHVDTYTSQLKFTVKVDGYSTDSST